MTVTVTSFGFKYGLPLEADLVFDVRFMPNPFYIEDLRPRTGLDKAVADYVFHFPQTGDYMRRLEDLIARREYTREVELDMVIGIIADAMEIDRDDLKRRRAESVRNVKATNGLISLEKRARAAEEPNWDGDQWQD